MIKSFEGNTPVLHPTAFVSEMAYIVGDVEIGEGSSIWPGTVIRGDMGKVKIGKFSNVQDNSVVHGDADVVIGGPPCQSFSTAGVRKGFDDKRGIALLEFIRVIRETRPKFFVFENVPGLKSIAKKHIGFYEREAMDKSKLLSKWQFCTSCTNTRSRW